MPKNQEQTYMQRALMLAMRGRGEVSPNPRVGAVIVSDDDQLLGEGYHQHFGDPHAEVMALQSCKDMDITGSTMYVTLEPCCTTGKTPPCVDAIIPSGIRKVVVATKDPDPRVSGKGVDILRRAGIEVEVGMLGSKARYTNRGFFSHHIRGRSYCSVKIALSIDGKMSNPDGHSQWITGPEACKLAHAMRADHDGVMVGSTTVRNDDPELTVRSVRGVNPVRVILAPHGGIPIDGKLAQTAKDVRTILVTLESADIPESHLENIELLSLPDRGDGTIDPELLLQKLPQYGILSLMIEGGSGVLSSFMQADMIDEITVGIAPSVIGEGISPFEQFVPKSWDGRPRYIAGPARKYGNDTVIVFQREIDPFLQD